MEEKDIWYEDATEDKTRFKFDKRWLKCNSDTSRERLRLVKYPDTEKDKVQIFYSKIAPNGMITWDDGTEEMSYKELCNRSEVTIVSDAYAKYFGDGDSEYRLVNTIEDLYEI